MPMNLRRVGGVAWFFSTGVFCPFYPLGRGISMLGPRIIDVTAANRIRTLNVSVAYP